MNITYKGKQEKFYPAQTEKIEAKFKKLAKILDGKGEKSSHVILASNRGVHSAEITVNYLDHSLVGAAKDGDQYTAMTGALEKLEKQILKLRAKRRNVDKTTKTPWAKGDSEAAAMAAPKEEPSRRNGSAKTIYRVDYKTTTRKPMTLDEAVLELGSTGDYIVYRDARKDCMSVLIRRPDGHLDLIES
ncbi:MAG: ribosome-associated translation inhibitor RaiA [Bryobacteraceae bacterium]